MSSGFESPALHLLDSKWQGSILVPLGRPTLTHFPISIHAVETFLCQSERKSPHRCGLSLPSQPRVSIRGIIVQHWVDGLHLNFISHQQNLFYDNYTCKKSDDTVGFDLHLLIYWLANTRTSCTFHVTFCRADCEFLLQFQAQTMTQGTALFSCGLMGKSRTSFSSIYTFAPARRCYVIWVMSEGIFSHKTYSGNWNEISVCFRCQTKQGIFITLMQIKYCG